MDKNILNAVAEVLKDERAKFDRQIEELRERADYAVGNEADIAELKSSIEFLFEEVDKKTDSIDFELAVMTKKESEDFLFKKIKEQTAALHDENASALDKIENAIKSLKDGANGADGANGSDGVDGADGRDGIDNPAIAPIEIAPDHKAEKGLIVKHRGGLWQAIRNTNGDPDVDSGNWKCFVDGVAEVDITFSAKEGIYSFNVEKSNGEREILSIDRMPAYLPPSADHKSVEGDYFLDGTSLNLYLDSEWVAVDLKGNRGDAGENGNRGRKGRDGVGISDIFVADGNLQILLTDGEVKDIYLDVLNSQPEDINQEIKRYAGIWHTSQSYQAGDVATMMGALYVCISATSDSPESSDDWALMVAPAIGGAGGGESGSGIGIFPDYGLVGESAPSSAGKKFSSFTDHTGGDIIGVGLDASGHNVKFRLTTDSIAVNPNPFRNAKNGQFIGTPEDLAKISNQRDVNEFLYKAIGDIEAGEINLEGYATEVQLEEVDLTSQLRDEALDKKIDQESNLNTVAHLKLEDQILRAYAWSEGDNEKLERKLTKVDEDLQEQITENKGASEFGDRQLQSEIDQLALALETLLVQREHGQWKYVGFSGDTIPRNAGEFALISDDLSANDNIITLNQEDLKGITHGFGDVEVGDYIEIVDFDEPSSYVLFVVTKAPEGTGIVNVEVKLKDKGQNILIGETCEIRFFAINEQDIALEEFDDRFVNAKGGDAMEGPLEIKGRGGDSRATSRIKTLGVYSESSSALRLGTTTDRVYIEEYNTKFNGGVLVDNIGPKTEDGRGITLNVEGNKDSHLVTKKYVDTATQSSSPMSAKLNAGFQMWGETRLAEGCFNLLDENREVTSKIKSARFLTFRIIQDWDDCEWMSYALTGKGQIHLTDVDGKYQMSKFILSAEKHDATSGNNPAGALWFFELEEYGFYPEITLSGIYFIEFDKCLSSANGGQS